MSDFYRKETANPEEEGLTVYEFQKNQRETVKVRLTEYGKHPLIDIRAWYEDKDGSMKPGRGLSLRRDLIPDLKKAISEAEKRWKQEGRADGNP